MEFKSPELLYEKLSEYILLKPIFGYTGKTESFQQAVINWNKRRHDWDIKKEWIVNTSGVVNAISAAISAYSDENDGVIIFKPVYYPFMKSIEKLNRKVVNVPLINNDNYYTIEFEKFEIEARKVENKMLIFCSPHNPVGRVWDKQELEKLAKIAVENDLIVVSDEIWYDLISKKHQHTVLSKISEEIAEQSIICTAPSKTFNVAGMAFSNIIIQNKELRKKFAEEVTKMGIGHVNLLGYISCEILYNNCEKWLDEVIDVIESNQKLVKDFFESNYPDISAHLPEGTYLQWIDFRKLNLNREDLEKLLLNAEIFSSKGHVFGEEGEGYQRFNVSLPTEYLHNMLKKLLEEIKNGTRKEILD